MKKLISLFAILYLAFLIIPSNNLKAKESKLLIGPKLGLNISGLSVNDNFQQSHLSSKVGIDVGVSGMYFITNNIALQAELFYSQKGSYYDYDNSGDSDHGITTLNYIELPLLGRYVYEINKQNSISGYLGPIFDFWLGGKNKYTYTNPFDNSVTNGEEDIKDLNNSFGLIVGVGYTYYLKPNYINFDIRYLFGLSDLNKNANSSNSTKLKSISISVSYLFNIEM